KTAVLRKVRIVLAVAPEMRHAFDIGVEVAVLKVGDPRSRICMTKPTTGSAGVRSAGPADEERFAGVDVRVRERDIGQGEVRCPTERQLKGFHGIQLVLLR